MKKLLEVFNDAQVQSYTGEVACHIPNGLVVYGYLNSDMQFVELFADSEFGRSYGCCGRVHEYVRMDELYVVRLKPMYEPE